MKVCQIGSAKKAIHSEFIKAGAINGRGKILNQSILSVIHTNLKTYLKEAYGIERDIIKNHKKGDILNDMSSNISWEKETLYEIDAIHGIYYEANKHYHKNWMLDRTLSPIELVSKYIEFAPNKLGVAVRSVKNFTQEEVDKIIVGMQQMYPQVQVSKKAVNMVNGEAIYAISLSERPIENTTIPTQVIPGDMEDQYFSKEQDVIQAVIEPLLSKFKGATVEWITEKKLATMLKENNNLQPLITKGKQINGFAYKNKIYLVKGRVTSATALEEVLHLFVDSLKSENKNLFDKLLIEVQTNSPYITATVDLDYSDQNGFDQSTRDIESVTRGLRDAYFRERSERPEGIESSSFLKLARMFFKWFVEKLNDVFDMVIDSPRGDISKIPLNATLGEVAAYLNINDVVFTGLETTGVRYNIDPGTEEYDPDSLNQQQAEVEKKPLKQIKIERAEDQINRLKRIIIRLKKDPSAALMVATAEKLLTNTQEYIQLLESDAQTVSVTKFVGSPLFPESLSEKFLKFQQFGTFLHAFMEDLMLTALETGYTPLQILNNNPGYFASFYEENSDLINIEGLDEKGKVVGKILQEKLSDDIINIVGIVNESFSKGEVIIPEITIYGLDSMDRVVDGRLDFIIIRKDGSVAVKDFKTTKSNVPMTRYSHNAIFNQYFSTALSDGVHPAFQRFPGRSKASGFLAQIGAYKRILAQMGIQSKGDSIINILYSPEKSNYYASKDNNFVYDRMFVAEVPIEGEFGLITRLDENGVPTNEVNPLYTRVLQALYSSIPVENEGSFDDAVNNVERDLSDIATIPAEKVKLIIEKLKNQIDTQLRQINDELGRMSVNKADEPKIKELRERKQLIRETRDWFDKTFREGEEVKKLPDELILKGVLDKTKQLAKNLRDSSEKIATEENFKTALTKLGIRNKQYNDLKSFLLDFKDALLANVNEDNPVIREINESITIIEKGQTYFLDLASQQFSEVLLSLPKKNVEDMLKSAELMYEHEKEKLERIVAGDASVFAKSKFVLGKVLRKIIGSQSSATATTITDAMKEEAQKKLDKINYFLQYKTFDKEMIKDYVDNIIHNPESGFYLGSTILKGFGSLTGDDFRASYGNSELAITAMANYFVKMTQEANMRFFDRMEKIKVGSLTKKFASMFGSNQAANEAISQVIRVKNFETGEYEDYLSFRGPIDPFYIEKIDEFDYKLSQFAKERQAIKDSNVSDDKKKEEYKKLDERKKELRKQYTNYLVENSNPKLVPELYMLEVSLPEEIYEQIEELNTKINTIRAKANNKDWNIDESGRLEIKSLEYQISKLRKQAINDDPTLQEIFKKRDEYYEYHVNDGGFEYARNQVLKEYGENSKEYKIWLDLNSDLVPNPDWVRDYEALMQQRRDILSSIGDPYLDELYEERRKLMSKHRFVSRYSSTSIYNPLYMSEEDYEELMEIEKEIAAFYEEDSGAFSALSYADKKELRRIKNEMAKIKSTQNKPEFDKELDDRIKELIRIDNEIGVITDPDEISKLKQQYAIKEQEFKIWYDRNNTVKYTIGTIASKGKVDSAPRKFNTMAVPTDPNLMIRVPNSYYRTRTYKPAAYNPEYSPTLEKRRYGQGGYPSPKGIMYNKETGRFDIAPNAKWVNPKYREMAQNKEVLDFFNTYIMDEYYNKQVDMSANKLGFFFPGDTQSAYDTLMTDGLEGAKREAREWINNNIVFGGSKLDEASNKYGIAGQHRIRFSHNYKLPASLGTKDGINAVLKWGMQYEIYQSMEEANLAISPVIELLKDIKTKVQGNEVAARQIDKVIEIFEFEQNKFVYGKTYDAPDNAEKTFARRKLFRQFMSAISWGRLAFDPAMQGGNLVSGNVQMFLSTQGDRGLGTWKDWAFAKLQMYGKDGFLYNVILDWGKVDQVSLSTKILRYFNPTMNSMDKVLATANRSLSQRLLNRAFSFGDLAYVIQDKGEMEIAMSTLLKNLSAHKFNVYEMQPDGKTKMLDQNGNPILKKDQEGKLVTVSAYEALVDSGLATPGIRYDVAMTMEDLEAIRNRTHQEYLQYQGNYADQNQTKIESSMFGVLLMFFRKYLEPFIENRFKGAFGIGDPKNWVAGDMQMGWWTAFFKIFGDKGMLQGASQLLPEFLSTKIGGAKYNEYYKSKAGQVRREILFAFLATFAYVSLRGLLYGTDDDEDKDKELTWAQMNSMRLMAKVANESRSMVWIPYIGKADDFISNFATFTSAFNEGKTISKLVENTGYYLSYELFDSEYAHKRGYYQKDSYRYERDTPKAIANMLQLSGIENALDFFEPEFAVKKQFRKTD
jgi:hypothetical protein